jgi:hypothetical protein
LGWHDTTRPKETPKQPESEGPDMPRSDHPTYNWPTQRHYLNEALKHLEAFTDNMATFLELGNEAEAQVLTLDFGTSSVICCMDDLCDEPIAETNMAKRELPSRDEFPNQRKAWTFDDDQLVKAGHKLGLDDHQLAEHLNRSHRAIEFRRYHLRKAGEL